MQLRRVYRFLMEKYICYDNQMFVTICSKYITKKKMNGYLSSKRRIYLEAELVDIVSMSSWNEIPIVEAN